MRIRLFSAFLISGVLTACAPPSDRDRPTLAVFAAASLRDVAVDLADAFEAIHPVEVAHNFAGSNVLAHQIRAAPRADVFLSADESWVDFLDGAERTVAGTRRVFLGNRLVLISRHDARYPWTDPRQLATAEFRFLAIADPEAVPAGRYARAALAGLAMDGSSVWSAVTERVAPALDARAALALVESDPEILGIVYRTDALASSKVRVLAELEPVDGLPIRYCATLIAGGDHPESGGAYLDFLTGPAAGEIARRHGFTALDRRP